MNRPLAIAALALAACSPDFDPASQVDGMRVLAVQADPPEIAPHGDPDALHTAALGAFVLRPDWVADPTRQTTIVYLACTPVPGVPEPSPCVLLSELRNPTAALLDAAQASCDPDPGAASTIEPPPVAFAGAEACDGNGCGPITLPGLGTLSPPALALPEGYGELFRRLPADAPEQSLGVEAAVLAFAIDATAVELTAPTGGACALADVAANLDALWSARAHVLSVKRVRIRGPRAPDPSNENPTVPGIQARGVVLDPTTPLAGGAIPLQPTAPPEGDLQTYTELDAAGAPIRTTREELVYSWFSTAGELEDLHTRGSEVEEWRVGGGPALVAVVVRDHRGGCAWTVLRIDVSP
jgi:hypothetical protein